MRNHDIDRENAVPYPKFTEGPITKRHISDLPQAEQDRLNGYNKPQVQFNKFKFGNGAKK